MRLCTWTLSQVRVPRAYVDFLLDGLLALQEGRPDALDLVLVDRARDLGLQLGLEWPARTKEMSEGEAQCVCVSVAVGNTYRLASVISSFAQTRHTNVSTRSNTFLASCL